MGDKSTWTTGPGIYPSRVSVCLAGTESWVQFLVPQNKKSAWTTNASNTGDLKGLVLREVSHKRSPVCTSLSEYLAFWERQNQGDRAELYCLEQCSMTWDEGTVLYYNYDSGLVMTYKLELCDKKSFSYESGNGIANPRLQTSVTKHPPYTIPSQGRRSWHYEGVTHQS